MGKDKQREIDRLTLENKSLQKTIDDERKHHLCREKIWQEVFTDAYHLALHDLFGVSRGRYEKARAALFERITWILKMIKWETQAEGDSYDEADALSYTKESVDRELRQIVPPEKYKDWDTRYYKSTGLPEPKQEVPKPEDLRKKAKALMIQADLIEKGVRK